MIPRITLEHNLPIKMLRTRTKQVISATWRNCVLVTITTDEYHLSLTWHKRQDSIYQA